MCQIFHIFPPNFFYLFLISPNFPLGFHTFPLNFRSFHLVFPLNPTTFQSGAYLGEKYLKFTTFYLFWTNWGPKVPPPPPPQNATNQRSLEKKTGRKKNIYIIINHYFYHYNDKKWCKMRKTHKKFVNYLLWKMTALVKPYNGHKIKPQFCYFSN